jgi:hypothetical protein
VRKTPNKKNKEASRRRGSRDLGILDFSQSHWGPLTLIRRLVAHAQMWRRCRIFYFRRPLGLSKAVTDYLRPTTFTSGIVQSHPLFQLASPPSTSFPTTSFPSSLHITRIFRDTCVRISQDITAGYE